MGFLVEPLGHVKTLRGQILISRTDDDPPSPLPCVCTFKTSPCVPAPRPHVFNMWTCCRYTRRRIGCTHGGFSACHTTTPHTTTTHHHTPHHTPHTTPHHTTHHTTHHNHRHSQSHSHRHSHTQQRQRRRQPTLSFIRLNK